MNARLYHVFRNSVHELRFVMAWLGYEQETG